MPSFDIVSNIDQHEVSNAVDQANREVSTRFDFKDTGARLELTKDKITIIAPTDFQLKQVDDILTLDSTRLKQEPLAKFFHATTDFDDGGMTVSYKFEKAIGGKSNSLRNGKNGTAGFDLGQGPADRKNPKRSETN